jgi:hypothetical protein
MRVVELSNHPGDMLGDAARRRDHAFGGQRRRTGMRPPR